MNQPPTTLELIIQETLRRRAAGERLKDNAVIAAHPELMPLLEIELKKLRLIAGARAEAVGAGQAEVSDTVIRSQEMGQKDTDAPAAEVPLPQVEVPDFELLSFLGHGGFGKVYLGRHRIHGEFSAVKIFPKSHAAELDGVRAYKQRAQQNPSLVPIEHVGELPEAYYYVMPLADDVKPHSAVRAPESYEPKSLEWCIANLPPFSPEEIVAIGAELLEGLAALHEVGLTHCDVKPANIMAFGGHWRLGDLGLMGPTEHVSADRGTARFWPPEGPSDPTADLYALGITLYLLLSGGELLRFQDFLAGRYLPDGDPKTFFLLRQVIARSCDDDPQRRFPTAAVMREALLAGSDAAKTRRLATGSMIPWLIGGLTAAVVLAAVAVLLSGRSDTDLATDSPPPGDDTTVVKKGTEATNTRRLPHEPGEPPAVVVAPDTKPPRQNGQTSAGVSPVNRRPADPLPPNPFMPLVRVKPGEFLMGSSGAKERQNENERPEHTVRISRSFFIGQYEVTQRQYQQVMGENPSAFPDPDRPVENVNWHDAMEFCRRLSAREQRRYRLPTEAEWEYVCRAGGTTAYAAGAELTPGSAAIGGRGVDEGTSTVGSYGPNARNVHDMHGNVWEWCQDRWDKDYYRNSSTVDPVGSLIGSLRMIRGGSWRDGAVAARSASRRKLNPNLRRDDVGFRVVREEDAEQGLLP